MKFYLQIWNFTFKYGSLPSNMEFYLYFTFTPYITRYLYMPQFSQIFIHLACRSIAISISRAEKSVDPDQLASENLNPEHVTIN